MALIKCAYCEKDISDKARLCPHCGQSLVPAVPAQPEAAPMVCEECGSVIPDGMDACPNCGCPVPEPPVTPEEAPQKVEVTAVNLPKMGGNAKKNLIIGALAVVAVILAILIGSFVSKQKQEADAQRRREQYASDLKTASSSMLLGAIQAEKSGNLIKSVWYNAIYEEKDSKTDKYTRPKGYFVDDFNDALSNLFADSDFQSSVDSIEANQKLVAGYMKDLKNPPEEFDEAYDAIRELYDAYTALTNLATDPSGSLTTFSQNFNEADSEVANCYDAMKLYLD